MTDTVHLSYSLDGIDTAAQQFWDHVSGYHILAFSGDLGAGKTTFIHHLCHYLEVEDAVSSPTFALINEYHFSAGGADNTIYHMDWYRLRDAAEAINAGMEDCIDRAGNSDIWCFIEWPEKARELLPQRHVWVSIAVTGPDTRELTATLPAL